MPDNKLFGSSLNEAVKMGLHMLLPNSLPARHILRSVIPAMIIDSSTIVISYGIVDLARTSISSTSQMVDYAVTFKFMFLVILVTLTLLYVFGVYHRIWEYTSGVGINVLLKAMLVSTAATVIIDLLPASRPVPLSVVLLGNFLALTGFIARRYRSRVIWGLLWRWRLLFDRVPDRVLIVGAGLSGQDLAQGLRRQQTKFHMNVVGFVDDDPQKQGLYVEDRPVLGYCNDIPAIAKQYDIDLIAVAIHKISGSDFRRILEACESTKVRIKVVPDIVGAMKATHSKELLRPIRPEDLIGRNVITTYDAVDFTPIQGKVILVTGASGSIGWELTRQLPAQNPKQLILLDKDESGLHDRAIELKEQYPELDIVHALIDVTESESLREIFEAYHPEIVFHAAAYKHVPLLERYPNAAVKVNVGGTKNLALLARDYGVQRFVLVSTDKAVNPSSVMGVSKRLCEMIIRALAETPGHQTLFTSVRFGNVLGSRGSVVPMIVRQIDQGGPVTITHPEMTRYFMSIPEAANLIIHAACLTEGGDTFLLRMGEVVKIVELAERMIRLHGMRPYQDIDIKFVGIRPGEKLHEQLYDGAAETALTTLHPGIIKLGQRNGYPDSLERTNFFIYVDKIIKDGVSTTNALRELLYGLTPNEQYAITHANNENALDLSTIVKETP